jgi:outer membrane scaffolding protein for murein synthesis (MipA/OmpV family)
MALNKNFALWLLPCVCLTLARPAAAERLPLWEAGIGIAGIDFPIYRGSEIRQSYVLPVPYVSYHGDMLQVDSERTRALFFRRDWVELDTSLDGSVPAQSSSGSARHGMPNLPATLEIGPSLNFHLYYDEHKRTNIDLRLPARAAFAVDWQHFNDIGWLFTPQLNMDFNNIADSGWNIGVMLGVIYADRRYHQFFYNVAPQYVTADRPFYAASGGFSGSQILLGVSRRFSDFWFGEFVKWDDMSQAVVANSPLVTTKRYFTFGLALSWILDRSPRMVEVSDD